LLHLDAKDTVVFIKGNRAACLLPKKRPARPSDQKLLLGEHLPNESVLRFRSLLAGVVQRLERSNGHQTLRSGGEHGIEGL
jgi:hypothetical protein